MNVGQSTAVEAGLDVIRDEPFGVTEFSNGFPNRFDNRFTSRLFLGDVVELLEQRGGQRKACA